MPVVIKFDGPDGGDPLQEVDFGPYLVVEVLPDSIVVMDGLTPTRIATRLPDGRWEMDGMPGWVFQKFRVLSPAAHVKRDIRVLRRRFDAGETG
jgi:hypothetical protein